MLTGTDQNSILTSQDFLKEILSDLVDKDGVKFSVSLLISSMQLWKCFKAALNNNSMLKLHFLSNIHTFAMYCKNICHQNYATNHQTTFYHRIAPN